MKSKRSRPWWGPFTIVLVAGLVACGGGGSTALLCQRCASDGDCQGAPCFQDVSGQRFCGGSCASCPSGYSCQPVASTSGDVIETCFPDSESCADSVQPGGDLGGGAPPDGPIPPAPGDLGGGIPVGGAIGPTGGTVDRIFFGFTGDTRPAQCGGAYPQATINSIYTQMKTRGVQFALDQGDHMFNCGSGTSAFVGAKQQIGDYVSAASLLGKTVFMTMGNHECTGEASTLCTLSSYGGNPNYTAFMDALAPVSAKPYYRVDVMTNSGLAVLLVVADDAWDAAQQTWLTAQLTDADQHAKYTFVSKHHPKGNTDHPEFKQIYDLVTSHKYTLFFTGHSHLYKREFGDPRTLVIGCGGAPLAGGNFFGFGTALQGADDRIYVQIYDQATGNVMDSFDVAPQ